MPVWDNQANFFGHSANHDGSIRTTKNAEAAQGRKGMKVAKAFAAIRRATLPCAALMFGLAAEQHTQAADWQTEWKAAVDAANKEARVVCGCPQHPGSRKYLLERWAKDYPNIKLDYTPAVKPEWEARVESERRAGKYLWDVYFAGPSPAMYKLADDGALDPMVPALILPDVKDPATWGGWEDAFYDDEKKRLLSFWTALSMPWYSAKMVSPETIEKEGVKVLLDPAYKNKIVWWDPRYGGSGINYAYLIHKKFGEKALKTALVDQNPTLLHNSNAMTERMVRGTAAFSLGPDLAEGLVPYAAAGIPFDLRRMPATPDSAMQSTVYGIAAIFNRPPNPNAAKVFINWLLSKPVQEGLATATKNNSRRVDVVAPEGAPPRPRPGVTYLSPQMETFERERDEVMTLTRKLRPQ
jgi:iron(III) transport system substrate-binding protein